MQQFVVLMNTRWPECYPWIPAQLFTFCFIVLAQLCEFAMRHLQTFAQFSYFVCDAFLSIGGRKINVWYKRAKLALTKRCTDVRDDQLFALSFSNCIINGQWSSHFFHIFEMNFASNFAKQFVIISLISITVGFYISQL